MSIIYIKWQRTNGQTIYLPQGMMPKDQWFPVSEVKTGEK